MMRFLITKLKSIATPLLIAFSLISVSIMTVKAQETQSSTPAGSNNSENYLYQIMVNTQGILSKVQNLPNYFNILTQMALDWINPDTSDTTANLQQNFTTLSNAFTADLTNQNAIQGQLLSTLFNNATAADLPNANDLSYQTLLGMPYFKKDPRQTAQGKAPNAALNYITNISGISIPHTKPTNWPNAIASSRYTSFYNSVLAAESFNAYMLSNAYADYSSGGLFNQTQNTLISQASSADWFKQVGSENIGIVMRQILLYQSQTFVLLSQLLQTQKQALLAQTVGNTLLILNALNTETNLVQAASANR